MRVYRASNHTATPAFTRFAMERSDAVEYMDNSSFGGACLYRCELPFELSDSRVLDVSDLDGLTAQIRAVLMAGGMTVDQVQAEIEANASECVGDLHACCSQRGLVHAAFAKLAEQYDAVVFLDSFPAGCITVMLLIEGVTVEMTDITPSPVVPVDPRTQPVWVMDEFFSSHGSIVQYGDEWLVVVAGAGYGCESYRTEAEAIEYAASL